MAFSLEVDQLQLLTGTEGVVDHAAPAEVLELGPHEGAALAWLDVLEVHDRVGLAVEDDPSPLRKSAVDTCMGSTLASEAQAEGLLQPLARLGVARLFAKDAAEHLRRLVGQALLQTGPAEGGGHERVVGEHSAQPARLVSGRRPRPQESQQGTRLAIPRRPIAPQLPGDRRRRRAALLAVNLRRQPVALEVVRANRENRRQLGESLV